MIELFPMIWLIKPDREALEQKLHLDQNVLIDMGQVFEKQAKIREAVDSYRQSLARGPHNHKIRVHLLNLLLRKLNDRAETVKFAHESLALTGPSQREQLDYMYYLMEVARLEGRKEEGRKWAAEIAARCEGDPNWLFKTAIYYSSVGELSTAEQMIKRAMQNDRDNPVYHELLADFYARNDKLELAALEYKSTIALLQKSNARDKIEQVQRKYTSLLERQTKRLLEQ